MQHRKNVSPECLILQYEKRRFDGGPEIELIRQIEERQMIAELQAHLVASSGMAAEAPTQTAPVQRNVPVRVKTHHFQPLKPSSAETANPEPSVSAKPQGLKRRLIEAVLIGPMEILVGFLGLLTTAMALITFSQTKNAAMVAESHKVMAECFHTLVQGLIHVVMTPCSLVKVLLTR